MDVGGYNLLQACFAGELWTGQVDDCAIIAPPLSTGGGSWDSLAVVFSLFILLLFTTSMTTPLTSNPIPPFDIVTQALLLVTHWHQMPWKFRATMASPPSLLSGPS